MRKKQNHSGEKEQTQKRSKSFFLNNEMLSNDPRQIYDFCVFLLSLANLCAGSVNMLSFHFNMCLTVEIAYLF